ncbi:MAG: 2-C-methyl-D-erythritol 2,4-cyclodiphosphate synthase [Gracilimonas sp.]|jgi:2-C-methyl-D-erythritol 2,4-cyclodiphosphate synthase|nr:2-C-methyl-D-erythritol 2,4-cyclodiphosphate synthase [Gracilimonas sp.]
MKSMIRIGNGYDVHQFAKGRELILGGVKIPFEMGLLGHSDADVLLHSITDALFGSLALGDIGSHYPDTAPEYEGADSRILLRECYKVIKRYGFELGNLDATIVAEKPKLQPFIDSMRKNIAEDLQADIEQISVKATTSEKMGFVGKGEGIIAYAVVLLTKQKSDNG